MGQLFRKEVAEAQKAQYLGTIRVARNPRFAFVALTALMLSGALFGYLAWGQVTRKARLAGMLVPTLGTLNLTAPQAGTVIDLRIKEGDMVRAGDVLMLVDTDRATARGNAAALINQSLQQRQSALEAERDLARAQALQRDLSLGDRLRNTEAEYRQAQGELEGIQQRQQLAAKTVERYRKLSQNGFVAEIQVQQKQEELLDLDVRERTAQRSLTALTRDLQSLRGEMIASANTLKSQLVEVDRKAALLDQENTENSARGQLRITAPQAATVTALNLHLGQAVQSGQTLATLVPNALDGTSSTLEAHLYAPSRTAGFVQPGQTVWLRYAAFPYQKFGMALGSVQTVSRTPTNQQDLPAGQGQALMAAAQTSEPLYRITVALADQIVRPYGKPQPLKPGMTLEADVIQDRRAIWEWIFEPVLATARR